MTLVNKVLKIEELRGRDPYGGYNVDLAVRRLQLIVQGCGLGVLISALAKLSYCPFSYI